VSPIKQDITIIESCTIIGKNSIFKHDIIPYLRIRHGKSQRSRYYDYDHDLSAAKIFRNKGGRSQVAVLAVIV
jgi:hypothetical protein